MKGSWEMFQAEEDTDARGTWLFGETERGSGWAEFRAAARNKMGEERQDWIMEGFQATIRSLNLILGSVRTS